MNRKTIKKNSLLMKILLSLMLIMWCMVLMITPLNTMEVSAESGDVMIAGTTVSSNNTTYWKNNANENGVEAGTIDDYNAMYVPAAGNKPAELTLKGLSLTAMKNFNGIQANNNNLRIVLEGTNTIVVGGDLSKCGIYSFGDDSDLITINGNGTLNITGQDTDKTVATAIYSDGDLTVMSGTVIAKAGKSTNSDSIAIYVNDFTIGTDGKVTAIGNTAAGSSIGILTEKSAYNSTDGNFTAAGGIINAESGASGGTNDYDNSVGIWTEGNFSISAGDITATGGTADYNCDSLGLAVDGNFTATGGTVDATGGNGLDTNSDDDTGSYGISVVGTFSISEGTVKGTGGTSTGDDYSAGVAIYSSITSTGGTLIGIGQHLGVVTGYFNNSSTNRGAITIDNGGKITGTGSLVGVSSLNSYISVLNGELTGTSTSVDNIGIGVQAKGNLTVSGTGNTGGVVTANSAGNVSSSDPVRTAIQAASIVLNNNRAITAPENGTVKNGMIYNKSGDILQSNVVICQAEHLLDITAPVFETATVGYERPAAAPFTIRNEGSEITGNINLSLDDTGEKYFDISFPAEPSAMASGATDNSNFTIRPKTGLKSGTYKANVTFSYTMPNSPDYSKTSTVTFKVTDPATPTGTATKTDDDSNMILYTVFACISLVGAGGAAFAFRRKCKIFN